ncbi:MAG TPA: AAA family ATPase, partial [Candidatus Limnocylindrales bacterium]|nr:AAA family ATPase [Candidatus Limnocylindrales bacterium]
MPRIGPLVSPLLVGRDDVLALVDRRVAEAAAGRGTALLFGGEAGIGKTRLIGAVIRKAAASGFRYAKGDVAPQDSHVMLASLYDLARTMSDAEFGLLGREILDVRGGKGRDALGSRRILVGEVTDRILAAVDRPTALFFEDLQWVDEVTLDVISELARRGRTVPLLVVASYRLDELAPGSAHREWRSRLLTQRLAEEVTLGRLRPEDTALMTTLILATGLPAPREVVQAVHARTNGIPLHVEELLGAIETSAPDAAAVRGAAVPSTIEDAVIARIGRLSPSAQAVARAGAVVGRCFEPSVLAGIMDRPLGDLDEPLDELVKGSILYPFEYLDRGFYDFRHQLLRDAIYDSVATADLRRLHARAAEFGSQLVGASEVHASLHFERAGLAEQAYRSALQGAHAAAAVAAHREALVLYARAIANMPGDVDGSERAAVLAAVVASAMAIEEYADADAAAREAQALYVAAGDRLGAARLFPALLAASRRETRPVDERTALLAEATTAVDGLEPSPGALDVRIFILIEEVLLRLDTMELDRARELLDEAERLALELGSDERRLDVAATRGLLLALSGPIDAGLEQVAAIGEQARTMGFEDTAITAYRDASVFAVRLMRPDRARVAIEQGLDYANAIGQSHCAHVMAATGGLLAWGDGRWDDAIAEGRQSLADRGCARGSGMSRWALGYTALGRGELDEARDQLTTSLAFAERSGIPDYELAALWGLAEVALLANDPRAAVALVDRGLDVASRHGERARFVPFLVSGARASIAAGRPAEAHRWLDVAAEHVGGLDLATAAM